MSTLTIASPGNTRTEHSLLTLAPLRRSARRPWLRVILGIWTLSLLLSWAAVHYGRNHTTQSSAARFGLAVCGEVPCFHGLIPGKSAWSQALATFANAQIHDLDSGQPLVTLGQSSDHAVLDAVSIDVPLNMTITLGDVITLYGAPCLLYVYAPSNTAWSVVTLRYPGLQVQLDIIEERLRPESPVRHLFFTSSLTNLLPGESSPCHLEIWGWQNTRALSRWQPWRGFTSLEQYLQAQ